MFLHPLPLVATSLPARKGSHYLHDVRQLTAIPSEERARLEEVAGKYAFRASEYYLRLINWSDPADPIRRLIIPQSDELDDWGRLDASNEHAVTITRGVQHKYEHTVLLLCNEVCGGYCRYCFRKRLFMSTNHETARDVSEGLQYIASHPKVTNVLLTGGDPLMMSSRHLAAILECLRAIPHVRVIRIGSKMPAFDPQRLLADDVLFQVLRKCSTGPKRIYLMAHFDHPRELTESATACIEAFIRSGVICVNQCPLLGGINDDPAVLGQLYRELSWMGCPPYYLFQGRPTAGNRPFAVPIVRGWQIFREAMAMGAGLMRRARFIMSHETGKIEILGVDHEYIYLIYHQSREPALNGRLIRCHRDEKACWLDELQLVEDQLENKPPARIAPPAEEQALTA